MQFACSIRSVSQFLIPEYGFLILGLPSGWRDITSMSRTSASYHVCILIRTFSKDDGNVNVDDRKSRNQHSVVLRMLACPQLVVHMSFRTPFRGISRCAVNESIFCDVFTCFVTFPRTVCGFPSWKILEELRLVSASCDENKLSFISLCRS